MSGVAYNTAVLRVVHDVSLNVENIYMSLNISLAPICGDYFVILTK
jgi:hypothetical protein